MAIQRSCQHCGKNFETLPCHIKKGAGKYCSNPCRHAAMKGRPLTHGSTWGGGVTPTYRVWANMKSRCLTPTNPNYHRYGGRGISICKRWLKFENFIADMGEAPIGLTLDRIDNDGDYSPENCQWATRYAQYRNRSVNVWVVRNGERMIISDAAILVGISVKSFKKRMRNWPEDHWFDPPMTSRAPVPSAAV